MRLAMGSWDYSSSGPGRPALFVTVIYRFGELFDAKGMPTTSDAGRWDQPSPKKELFGAIEAFWGYIRDTMIRTKW
jgi:hypothetical protein